MCQYTENAGICVSSPGLCHWPATSNWQYEISSGEKKKKGQVHDIWQEHHLKWKYETSEKLNCIKIFIFHSSKFFFFFLVNSHPENVWLT